jgi:Uma2 family endonuclease
MTVEAFDEFALRPENRELLLEFIGGEIRQVVSNTYSSGIAGKIILLMANYLLENPIARLTPADGGYEVGNERYIPDVGITLKVRHPERPKTSYHPYPPELAIEVMSPTDSDKDMLVKVTNYLAAQCTVWVVYPNDEVVKVFVPNQPVKILGVNDTLNGGDVLPGFTLPVKRIFED